MDEDATLVLAGAESGKTSVITAKATYLIKAGTVMMHRGRATWLRTWAAQVARRRGAKRAMVALARRIAVILLRMWVDDTDFRADTPTLHAA